MGDPIPPTEIGPPGFEAAPTLSLEGHRLGREVADVFLGLPARGWTEKLKSRPGREASTTGHQCCTVRAAGKQAWGRGVVSTRIRGMWQVIVIVCMLGATGCSKTPTTAAKTVVPPVVVSSEVDLRVADRSDREVNPVPTGG